MSGRVTYCQHALLHDVNTIFISCFLVFLQACCIPISSTRNNKNRQENRLTLKFNQMFKFSILYSDHNQPGGIYITAVAN